MSRPGAARPAAAEPAAPVVRAMGAHALLVELPDALATLALYEHLRVTTPPWLAELVPAARTVLAVADPARGGTLSRLDAWITAAVRAQGSVAGVAAGSGGVGATTASVVELPVHYDGDDLREVARLTGLGVDGVIEAHLALEWKAAFIGFAPGFAYLVAEGAHPFDAIPRRPSPRTRVPAGAVALAAGYCGVYPTESPGGWQLIGRTDAVLWDSTRADPALLAPGTRVRFRRV